MQTSTPKRKPNIIPLINTCVGMRSALPYSSTPLCQEATGPLTYQMIFTTI